MSDSPNSQQHVTQQSVTTLSYSAFCANVCAYMAMIPHTWAALIGLIVRWCVEMHILVDNLNVMRTYPIVYYVIMVDLIVTIVFLCGKISRKVNVFIRPTTHIGYAFVAMELLCSILNIYVLHYIVSNDSRNNDIHDNHYTAYVISIINGAVSCIYIIAVLLYIVSDWLYDNVSPAFGFRINYDPDPVPTIVLCNQPITVNVEDSTHTNDTTMLVASIV